MSNKYYLNQDCHRIFTSKHLTPTLGYRQAYLESSHRLVESLESMGVGGWSRVRCFRLAGLPPSPSPNPNKVP